jgi:SAM-dependent methyltransferase
MRITSAITSHYTSNELLQRLYSALRDDGVDPAQPTREALAPYDQFHTRGLEATREIAQLIHARASDHLLDIGSGLGGPARWFAHHFGCRVTGIDLTQEFCDVARHLTALLHMDDRVHFDVGDATALPHASGSFDGAYCMNVSMNIRDKIGFYRELHRVLRPAGWLLLSEPAKGHNDALAYPTPWAASHDHSFLVTPEEMHKGLLEAGFEVLRVRSTLAETLDYGTRARAMSERGEKPPQRAVSLVHGKSAAVATANMARGLAEGCLVPIELLARRAPTAP